MDSALLLVVLVLCRLSVWRLSTSVRAVNRLSVIALVLAMIVIAALPILLIQRDVIDSSWINVVIAGIALFYFPFLAARLLGNQNNDRNGVGQRF